MTNRHQEHIAVRHQRALRKGLVLLLACPILLNGCSLYAQGFLAPEGPVAQTQRGQFFNVLAWMLIVVVPLWIATPLILWRFRLFGAGRYRPDWTKHRALEGAIWGISVFIVIALAVPLWRTTHDLDPYRQVGPGKPLEIQVIGLDWKFLFLYPKQRIATVNLLVIPAARPIRLRLTSASAMQSLFIPRLAGQIYMMGGMETELNLRADVPGTFRGQNAQYNGKHFSDQKFETRALSDADFAAWLNAARDGSQKLDAAKYDALTEPSILTAPRVFSGFPDELFHQTVTQVAEGSAPGLPAPSPSGAEVGR